MKEIKIFKVFQGIIKSAVPKSKKPASSNTGILILESELMETGISKVFCLENGCLEFYLKCICLDESDAHL